MAISPKEKVTLPQFLHYFKAHTLLCTAIFQYRPQHFADISATEDELNTFPEKINEQ